MTRLRLRLLLILLAGLVFLTMAGRRDIVISHEARVVQTARVMADSGWPWNARFMTVPDVKMAQRGDMKRLVADPDAPPLKVNPWMVPVLNEEIRLQKPPLPYWYNAVIFRLAGRWSETLARIVPALLGALSTLLVASLARRTLGRRAALPAALVWVSSYFIPDEFRKAMADPYLAFFTLAALWGWITSAEDKGTRKQVEGRQTDDSFSHDPKGSASQKAEGRNQKDEKRDGSLFSPQSAISTLLPLLCFYVSLALGMLAKGPPMLVHIVAPLVVYHLLHRRRIPGSIAGHLIGIVIFAAIALPWPAYVLNHVPHARELWKHESIGEMGENTHNARPWYYYIPLVFQLSLPWSAAFIVALGLPLARGPRPMEKKSSRPFFHPRWFPLASYALVVLFFSFVNLKKAAYLLPDMPFQTLMIAQALVMLMAGLRRFGPKSPAAFVLAGQSLVALGLCAAVPILMISLGTAWFWALAIGAIPVALALLSLKFTATSRPRHWLVAVAAAQALAVFAFINFYLAPKENRRSPKPVAAILARELNRTDSAATVMPRQLPPEVSVYLPVDVEFNPRAEFLYHVTDDPRGLAGSISSEYFQDNYPKVRILEVQRVEITSMKSSRWKLFRLRVVPQNIYAAGF